MIALLALGFSGLLAFGLIGSGAFLFAVSFLPAGAREIDFAEIRRIDWTLRALAFACLLAGLILFGGMVRGWP